MVMSDSIRSEQGLRLDLSDSLSSEFRLRMSYQREITTVRSGSGGGEERANEECSGYTEAEEWLVVF